MYRILIVEDEPAERESLSKFLHTNFPNEISCISAGNGAEALDILEKAPADIVIMDINMPGVNGLEALRNLRENGFQNQIIIFSAYDYTDYLKMALNYGADAFVLKPEQIYNLSSVIRSSMKAIDELRQNRSMKQQLSDQLAQVAQGIIHPLVNMSIWDDAKRRQALRRMEELPFTFSAAAFLAVELSNPEDQNGDSVKDMLHAATLLRVHPFPFQQSFVSLPRHNIILILCLDPSLSSFSSFNFQINQAVRHYQSLVAQNTHMQVRIGVGAPQASLELCAESYPQSMRALCHTSPAQPVLFFSQVRSSLPHSDFSVHDYTELTTLPDALECLHADFVKQLGFLPRDAWAEGIFCYWTALCRELQRAVPSADLSPYLKFEISALRAMDSQKAVHLWLDAHSEVLLSEVLRNLSCRKAFLIQQAVDYIDHHFSEPLSLDVVSEKVGITPHYLSHIFPLEFGQNFLDYLTEVRMKNLTRLLRQNAAMSTGELARKLGYSDSGYFCKVVKRVTGKTLKELRLDFSGGGRS